MYKAQVQELEANLAAPECSSQMLLPPLLLPLASLNVDCVGKEKERSLSFLRRIFGGDHGTPEEQQLLESPFDHAMLLLLPLGLSFTSPAAARSGFRGGCDETLSGAQRRDFRLAGRRSGGRCGGCGGLEISSSEGREGILLVVLLLGGDGDWRRRKITAASTDCKTRSR